MKIGLIFHFQPIVYLLILSVTCKFLDSVLWNPLVTNTISTRVLHPGGQSEGLKTMLIVSGPKKILQKISLGMNFPHTLLYVFKNRLKLPSKTDEIWGSPTSPCYKTGVIRARYIFYLSSISIFSSISIYIFFPSQIF